jgi:hypothetical protein
MTFSGKGGSAMNTPFVEGLEFNLLLFELRWNKISFLGMLGKGLTPLPLAHIILK